MDMGQKHQDETLVWKGRDKASKEKLEVARKTAIHRVLSGEPVSVVASDMGFHRSRIYKWLKIHRKKGLSGLVATKATGRPPAKVKRKKPPTVADTAAQGRKRRYNLQPDEDLKLTIFSPMDQWLLVMHQSVLDPLYPMDFFLKVLGNALQGGATISPNLEVASSYIRPFNEEMGFEVSIALNKIITTNWSTNPFIPAMKEPGIVCALDEILPPDEWMENDFCRRLLLRSGYRAFNMLGLSFQGAENTLCGLFAYRAGNPHYTQEERAFLLKLMPHLELAVNAVMRHWHLSYKVTALEEATNRIGNIVFVLDGNRQVISSDSATEKLPELSDYLTIKENAFVFRNKDNQKLFDRAVDAAIAWRQEPISAKPAEVLRFERSTDDWLGLLIQPITPPSYTVPHSIVVSPHVVIYINNPAQIATKAPHQMIAKLFGLSLREAHLATLLSGGSSLSEAATAMNITYATAKTYLKHIYEKMGVRRRQDLLQRVLKSVAQLV